MLADSETKLDDLEPGHSLISVLFGTDDVMARVSGRYTGMYRCRQTKSWRIGIVREIAPFVDHGHYIKTQEIIDLRLATEDEAKERA
jgi:hypothetical protein